MSLLQSAMLYSGVPMCKLQYPGTNGSTVLARDPEYAFRTSGKRSYVATTK